MFLSVLLLAIHEDSSVGECSATRVVSKATITTHTNMAFSDDDAQKSSKTVKKISLETYRQRQKLSSMSCDPKPLTNKVHKARIVAIPAARLNNDIKRGVIN